MIVKEHKMKIGVIQATSNKDKNRLIYDSVKKAVEPYGYEVINFGVSDDTADSFSYIEIAICVSLLLSGKAVDFVVTGCSSGQGMMLACNSLPGVVCGYTPKPQDAILFGRINDGNAISLPMGFDFDSLDESNLQCILSELFDHPFGTGYPPDEAERKKRDTKLFKQINKTVKKDWSDIIDEIDQELIKKALSNPIVYDYIMQNSSDEKLKKLICSHL